MKSTVNSKNKLFFNKPKKYYKANVIGVLTQERIKTIHNMVTSNKLKEVQKKPTDESLFQTVPIEYVLGPNKSIITMKEV